ncbi:MlaD family protein [Gordonia sp. CPCC 205333]|uniref:MlaD family protein n=1 Tax=Gordonia sp. CPCC 205333 TaxID=3140790 RepID=UPI003AF36DB3
MKLPAPVTLVLLAAITVVGSVYMAVGVLHYNPADRKISVAVEMNSSGGLMTTSRVTLRGIEIGRVESLEETSTGLRAQLSIDAGTQIPAGATVRVANLSAAGEQYLDFTAAAITAPYLSDGSVVSAAQVRPAATVSETLERLDALTASLDPSAISKLVATMGRGFRGREAEFTKIVAATTKFAALLDDKAEKLRVLYHNVQVLGDNFAGYGPTISRAATDIGVAIPDLLLIVRGYERYSYVGEKIFDDPIGPLVTKLTKYCAQLCPDFTLIATLLSPYTRLVRPFRADIGHLLNAMLQVFPGDGTAHVAVTVGGK